jgi:hypothetical protein
VVFTITVHAFKPEVWSKVILAGLQKNLVFGGPMCTNDDYEGEISGPGDVVHITQFADPVISTYSPGTPLNYQPLSDAGLDVVIDQSKSFSFQIDDVDKRQAAGDMQSYLEERASYKFADVADQFLASMYTGCATSNILLGTDGETSSLASGNYLTPAVYSDTHPADFYQQVILPLKVRLTQCNVPLQGRYLIVPPWAEALLEQTKAFIAVTDMQGQASDVFQNGLIGRAGGFNILTSNNSVEYDAGNGAYVVQAGHRMAVTFGEQIVQTEALRLIDYIADAVRGLHVYGGKLVRPDCIAVAGVKRPAGL